MKAKVEIAKTVLPWIVIAIVVVLCVLGFKSCYEYCEYEATYEYKLQEIEDGVYGYYNTVSSSIPAENYEVITLYFNGSLTTLDGNVTIRYTDTEPKVVWHYERIVHGSDIVVYVPKGSIEMRPNVGLG
jgi:hypothetical protein